LLLHIASATKKIVNSEFEYDIVMHDVNNLGKFNVLVEIWYDLDVCVDIFKMIKKKFIPGKQTYCVKNGKIKYYFISSDLKLFRIKKLQDGKTIEYTLSKNDDEAIYIVTSDPNNENVCYTLNEAQIYNICVKV
jgi:hypothetical protein